MKGEKTMEKILNSIKQCLDSGNSLAALFLTVTLPDICGSIEESEAGNGDRYKNWCNTYLKEKYEFEWSDYPTIANKMHIPDIVKENGKHFITILPSHCLFYLRCSLLHEGSQQIEIINGKPKGNFMHQFEFTNNIEEHCHVKYYNATGKISLVLHTRTFCMDICKTVENWLKDHPTTLPLNIEE